LGYTLLAITSMIADHLQTQGIDSTPIYDGFSYGGTTLPSKEDLVLADSRWVKEREPLRIVTIAERLPNARIIMIGRIPDPKLKDELRRQLESRGLIDRVQLSPPLREEEITDLYLRARVVLRWVRPGMEDGFTWSLVNAVSAGCVPVMSDGIGGSRHLAGEVSPDLVQSSDES